MKRLFSTWWSMQPAEGWTVQDDAECVTLLSPDGAGAFQLSAASKESDAVTLDDVREFAEPTLGEEGGSGVERAGFLGLQHSCTVDGHIWFYYWLARDHVLVFATYNRPGQLESAKKDIVDIEAMLESLRLEPAGQHGR